MTKKELMERYNEVVEENIQLKDKIKGLEDAIDRLEADNMER